MLVLTMEPEDSTFLDLPDGLGTIEIKLMPRIRGKSLNRTRVGFGAPINVGIRRKDAKPLPRSGEGGGPDYSHGPRPAADPSTAISPA